MMISKAYRAIFYILCLFSFQLQSEEINQDDQELVLESSDQEPDHEDAVAALQDQTDSEAENDLDDEEESEDEGENDGSYYNERLVNDIIIHGNRNVTKEAIISKIPYHIGEPYTPFKSGRLIRNILSMGFFRTAKVYGKNIGNDRVDLHVVVEEKPLLKEMIFRGNKNLGEKEIIKKGFDPKDIQAMDEIDLEKYRKVLKKLYRDKDYHNADIQGELIEENGKVVAIYTINENKKSIVHRVFFKGNKAFDDKVLRARVFTREDWILSFMDKSGSFQPDAIESDRHMLEDFYQSNGYLNAKVVDVDIDHKEGTNHVSVTFEIDEGELYTISSLSVPGNDVIPEDELLGQLPIRVGDVFSKEKIRHSIEKLRMIWGQHGYMYADIEPSIEPDDDNKTVAIAFFTELGDKVYVNRINIVGNAKTRDKIIRRQISKCFEQGDLITTEKMENAKQAVEGLGYFEQQDGVSWKVKRQDKENVDIDLYVREIKTGRVDFQVGFGGAPKDLTSVTEKFRIGGTISDTNLFGLGIAFNLATQLSKNEKQMAFNLTQPWLFDRPIYASIDSTVRRSTYEDFKFTRNDVTEDFASGSASLGFISETLNATRFVTVGGYEGIHFTSRPEVNRMGLDPKVANELQLILNQRFPEGNFPWIGFQSGQDFRNHPLHPSRGYQWLFQSKCGVPHPFQTQDTTQTKYGFMKFDLDASYYTPIIGERDLVLYLHGHFGGVTALQKSLIPFRELYHVGGPASVRGFLFGEISPQFVVNNNFESIGATKAFWLNAELQFPIAPDFSIKGVVFYDGGSGWATPNADLISPKRLKSNGFSYRHSVGFGVRILRPTPVRIDWGFKLDRRTGEKESEVHLTMAHDF